MKRLMIALIACGGIAVMAAPGVCRDKSGELGLSVGGIFPQGNFVAYADPGPTGFLRLSGHLNDARWLGLWADLSASEFMSHDELVPVAVEGYTTLGKQTTTQYQLSLHVGLQLGSQSQRGFIRPRLALAPGLYLFNTSVNVHLPDGEEDLYDDDNVAIRPGWRAVGGVDLFFTAKWGISLDVTYDHVFNLHHLLEIENNSSAVEISRSARFIGYSIGVVWPI